MLFMIMQPPFNIKTIQYGRQTRSSVILETKN